jgi:hypothetical protein
VTSITLSPAHFLLGGDGGKVLEISVASNPETASGAIWDSEPIGDGCRVGPKQQGRWYARRNPSHVPVVAQQGHVLPPIRIRRATPPKLTAEQKADLIEHGMPERLVRNGNLDHASLISGSMSDRIRNGCC